MSYWSRLKTIAGNRYKALPTIASATDIYIPEEKDVFAISGTTTVATINKTGAYFPGRVVLVYASASFAITDTAAATKTQGGVHLSAAYSLVEGDTLTLMCGNGGDWYELARSHNG